MARTNDRITAADHPELVGKTAGKMCPNGHPYKIRVNRDTDELFLGCTKYPDCRETSEIPLSLWLRLTGAPTLPGME